MPHRGAPGAGELQRFESDPPHPLPRRDGWEIFGGPGWRLGGGVGFWRVVVASGGYRRWLGWPAVGWLGSSHRFRRNRWLGSLAGAVFGVG
jgi:hypothetical protein